MRSPPLERESTVYRHFPVLLLLLACFAFAMPVMAGERPIVGINMALSDKDTSETTPRTTDVGLALRSTYVDAVIAAGGLPVLIPPVLAEDRIPEYCDLVDAFLFVGGPDINPRRYGQDPHALWNPINPRREQFDFLLMDAALKTGKPVLAVCLGMQQLSVSRGGTMVQDIPSHVGNSVDHRPKLGGNAIAHEVAIVPGTRLHRLLGVETLAVNSLHHQACLVPGRGLVVAARAPDGVIEAVELPDHPFAIGVQWHPEYLTDAAPHLNLFRGLVNEARLNAKQGR
jgi:putative glutamine amidotransferase